MPKSYTLNGSLHKWFKFSELRIIRDYQRALDKRHVAKIKKVYHADLLDFPLVCIMSNGDVHIANGQHSIEVYMAMNPQTKGMYCRVTTLDPDEAFRLKNTNNKKVSADILFWTSYHYGRPAPLAVERICNKYGIFLQKSGALRFSHTSRVALLLNYYWELGPEKFEKYIKLLSHCFRVLDTRSDVQREALQSAFNRGFMDFAAKQPPNSVRKIKQSIADSRRSAADILNKAMKIKGSSGSKHAGVASILRKMCE